MKKVTNKNLDHPYSIWDMVILETLGKYNDSEPELKCKTEEALHFIHIFSRFGSK